MSDALKTQRVLLESAARTATTVCAQQFDPYCSAVRLYLNVTVASGTGGLQPILRGYDKFGNVVALSTGGTAITATGTYCYEFGIAIATASGNVKEAVSRFLPVRWDIQTVHGDSSSYTYTLACEVLAA